MKPIEKYFFTKWYHFTIAFSNAKQKLTGTFEA